ncbi:ABC transporter permease [Candidatus Neomarinimicrobiota bacterium]
MLKTIIRREILSNITSLRFAITLLLITVVFVVSGFVFGNRYGEDIRIFNEATNSSLSRLNGQTNNLSSIANHIQTIHKRPKITQLFYEGFEKSLPGTYFVNVFILSLPEIATSTIFMNYPEIKERENYLLKKYSDIDWVFIISLILSFIALIMTFDCISSERERGTLPLVMSNSIPRHMVILGKYISAILTMMIPLIIGLLLNIIIVSISGSVINASQWGQIAIFLGVSILYISIFLLLGILISSRSAKSSSSIVALLFIWVVIVMIIPASGKIISEKYIDVPTRSELESKIHDATQEIWDNSDRYGENAGNWGGGLNADSVNPPARARLFNAMTDMRGQMNDEHINRWLEQVYFGRNIIKISPASLYQGISESIFGNGISRFRSLYSQLKRYQKALRDFVIETDQRDPDSWHLLAEGRQHQILLSQKPVDYNAIPKFIESEVSVGESLKYVILDLGTLILINILLFVAVYVSFLRCDVR